jgi:hypothetical protein
MRDNLLINFSDSKIPELFLTNSFVTIMKLTISNIVQQSTQLNKVVSQTSFFEIKQHFIHSFDMKPVVSAFGIVVFL